MNSYFFLGLSEMSIKKYIHIYIYIYIYTNNDLIICKKKWDYFLHTRIPVSLWGPGVEGVLAGRRVSVRKRPPPSA